MPGDRRGLSGRKADHLDLCQTDRVSFRAKGTLFDQVGLVHDALPELSLDQVDLSTSFAGRPLRAPLVIAAMTGGVARAERINRALASVAERHGIGFGFGSQRPMLEDGATLGYRVRDLAPTALVLGNIGIVQAGRAPTARLVELVRATGADALCVHLNPAMELAQPRGDRDFRGGLDTIRRLVQELPVPVVVKETGCGLSRGVGRRLAACGVRHVDCSGAGGTSWVGVESLRAPAWLGRTFWDWGIPTAASLVQLDGLGLQVCATGGIANGLDIARALALGAACAGVARPLLQAWASGGEAGVDAAVTRMLDELRVATLLAGARGPAELRNRPLVLGPELERWVPRDAPLRARSSP